MKAWIPTVLLLTLVSSPSMSFAADKYLTRAESAKFLLTYSREEISEVKSFGEYPDVLPGQWYTSPLLNAIELGMIDKEPEHGLIYPHKTVSRAEFLKMLTIAFGLKRSLPYSYTDITGTWYKPYVGVAQYYNLFDEKESTTLDPSRRLTHSEAERAVLKLFLSQPTLKPKILKELPHVTDNPKSVKKVLPTPELVKNAMLRLFRTNIAPKPTDTSDELIALVNEERRQFGLTPLEPNYELSVAAALHAKDMDARGYFSHVTPEGENYVDRIKETNYLEPDPKRCTCRAVFNLSAIIEKNRSSTSPGSVTSESEICGCQPVFALGENLAKGQLTAWQVLDDWMESDGHRRNILHPQFREIGIGLFGKHWVQNFGFLKWQ